MALQNGARERDSRFLSLFTVVRSETYCVDIYHTFINSMKTCYLMSYSYIM